jgi:hypothetical protein
MTEVMVDVLGTEWKKKGSWCVSAMGCRRLREIVRILAVMLICRARVCS